MLGPAPQALTAPLWSCFLLSLPHASQGSPVPQDLPTDQPVIQPEVGTLSWHSSWAYFMAAAQKAIKNAFPTWP